MACPWSTFTSAPSVSSAACSGARSGSCPIDVTMASAASANSLPCDRDDGEVAAPRAGLEAHANALERKACALPVSIDRAQHRAVDERDAFLQRFGDLVGLRRHLRAAFERQDRHRRAPRGARCARRRARRCRRRSPRRGDPAPAARRRWRERGSRRRPSPRISRSRVEAAVSGSARRSRRTPRRTGRAAARNPPAWRSIRCSAPRRPAPRCASISPSSTERARRYDGIP